MHLKQLKLAGFKSFVDPTVVLFPSQLVGVVGPNGCGKSNIIDAVRWVTGESSAKNLRGESMADVIFNGSSDRKPLSQASVELVFDNSLGRLTGPFASYGEVAVRRVVTRDGESSYYLNGARCRLKDIRDMFLGTGAGPRGYSIIGQGTISRMIEAKPEELRAFLEEAAGVSKYKERRRETLQRIEHTRDNLTRVADIREELDKQLQRLERQAKAAERYTILKEEEQICRAEILALKWQDFTEQQIVKQGELQTLVLNLDQQQSLLTGLYKNRTVLNEKLHDFTENSQQLQESFYQLGTEIARLEESIQQKERENKRLENDKQQLQNDWQQAEERVKADKEELSESEQKAVLLTEQAQKLRLDFQAQEIQLQEAQKVQSQWESQWQLLQNQTNTRKRELQVAQVNSQHLAQKRNQTLVRLEKLNNDKNALSPTDLLQLQNELKEKQVHLKIVHDKEVQILDQSTDNTNQLRAKLKDAEEQLHQNQDSFYRLNSELAALTAAQKAAKLGNKNKAGVSEWSDKARLLDVLKVETQWQSACEMILNDTLQAYVLDDFEELWPQLQVCSTQGESVVTLQTKPLAEKQSSYPRLVDKIHGQMPLTVHNLETIYAAEDLEEAVTWLPTILASESIVTASGYWLGKGWVKFICLEEQDEIGLMARQQKIVALTAEVALLQDKIEAVRELRDNCHNELQTSILDTQQCQLNLNASNEALRTVENQQARNDQSILQTEQLLTSLKTEVVELEQSLEEVASQFLELSATIGGLETQCKEDEQKQAQLELEKNEWITALAQQQQQRDSIRQALHQSELEKDREVTREQQLQQRISREQERLDSIQERLEQLSLQLIQLADPSVELKAQLTELLLRHAEMETLLTASREQVSQIRIELEGMEKTANQHDMEVKRIQELIGQCRMEEQALAVRASAVQESLDETGLRAASLLERIPAGVTQSIREDDLIALAEKIKRLGAINLAAIEEFSTEQQRKLYLDEQYEDLNQALATLETAINKMDNETRLRLETTFDEVNTSFKTLFPRLFGGGRAQLELTCDNLLEAGIVVMAQPPGKRNSTIHLLSGGEKAMTAVALVFAIFQLNPSPFCMLDEVDAPLDDVNVGRFCDLVKEMSQFVQFLFITHNKVTMELANHLIGVTMREPGVSRLVTVDVKQALTME